MRYVCNVFRLNMLRWKTSLRIIMLLIILPVIQIRYAIPYIDMVKGYDMPMHIFEPYIAAFAGYHASLLVSIVVVFILADVPIRNTGFELSMIRGTKHKWLVGQWMYILICAVIVCSIIAAFDIAVVIPRAYLPNEWSIPSYLISMHKTAEGYTGAISQIPPFILQNDLPVRAFLYTFSLQFLLFIFFGTLTVCINLVSSRIIAPIVLLLMNGINWLIYMFVPGDRGFNILSWLSPLYHGTYSQHQYQGVLEGRMASPGGSALILLGASIACIAVSHALVRKSDILNFTGGDFDA